MARRRRHRTCREPVGGEGHRFAGASGPQALVSSMVRDGPIALPIFPA
ncbi:hypothetical protein HMPREF3150_06308 [Pseudomonas aeruginosa]|nr:hypothetical protein HMPREF3150_06308 [Pseudomonas aeruginosa]